MNKFGDGDLGLHREQIRGVGGPPLRLIGDVTDFEHEAAAPGVLQQPILVPETNRMAFSSHTR
jgi:hypothetical protein